MIFLVQFYKGYDRSIPLYTEETTTLYEAMVTARKGTQKPNVSKLADVFDAHGQFIFYFKDGELCSNVINKTYKNKC